MIQRILGFLVLLLTPSLAQAAFSVVQHQGYAVGQNGTTTSAINTTGANLIIISVSWYNATTMTPTVADSPGGGASNTWTKLTTRTSGTNSTAIWYCVAPTVNASHTFSVTGTNIYAAAGVLAVSGAAASPFDQQSGAAATQPGSLTPSENNCLIVTTTNSDTGMPAGPSGYTWQNVYAGGSNTVGGIAYKIQTTAGAENPLWGGGGGDATTMAVFKASAASARDALSSTIPGVIRDPLSGTIPGL